MRELAALLGAFHDAMHCGAVVWARSGAEAPLQAIAGAPQLRTPPEAAALPRGTEPAVVTVDGDALLVAAVAGPRPAWVGIGPLGDCRGPEPERLVRFLASAASHAMRSALELGQAAGELAERYEEINLLYTTSEILGRTVTLEEAADTILTEISETVGARRAAILVHDRVTDTLQAVAALGAPVEDVPPVATDDPDSVSARVFRTQHPMLVEPGECPSEGEWVYRDGAMLSVPILWTAPDGGTPLGVVNLSGRHAGQPFTAGDQKLVAAIATQIGTAIQNTRLVRSSLSQQRLVQEMQLAHDLQMKLLPRCDIVRPDARVAARVIPAESVGGDFYHLFPLGGGRTGIMIGDVSGHGYRAALIMALVMSAAAIHAQSTTDPALMLRGLQTSLREELQTTEMFLTVFYGIIDRDRGELCYANAGHPHAFHLGGEGAPERLAALDPPLGMVEQAPGARRCRWRLGHDTLLLFTDGVADARDRHGRRLGEQPVLDTVLAAGAVDPDVVMDRVLEMLMLYSGASARRDDLTLVLARS